MIDNGTQRTWARSYDAAWNLNYRTNNGATSTFTVDSKDQLTAAAGNSCTYDSNGNLVANGALTYGYDDENRLVAVTNATAGTPWRTEFPYGGLGRLRIRKEYEQQSARPSRLGPPRPAVAVSGDSGGRD